MAATLYLLACALATAQTVPGDASDWQLAPRLGRGQELVYRGTYAEEAKGQAVQFNRSYRMEARVFVLDAPPQGAEVAFFTVWKGRSANPGITADEAASARLEVARIDTQGRIVGGAPGMLTVPLDGPPIVETGAMVEVPRGRMRPEQTWDVVENGRPVRSWRVAAIEMMNGSRCMKLQGVQQSDDWDKPRADRTAWRRQDTVWIAQRNGIAQRVERIIERREPARKEPTQKSVVRYELESSLQYPGQLYEDRVKEIRQTAALAESVAALLPRAGQLGARPFEALLKRIEYHYDHQPPTPYRDAVRHIQRLAEAGKRGDVPPEVPTEASDPVANVLALGKTAPDFLVVDLVTKETVRLKRWIGHPILLVFYNPKSPSARELLQFAQSLANTYKEQVTVLGMAVSDDAEPAVKQREELNLTFPILSGTGLRLSYRVESTPKLVVLDGSGVMRGSYLGWGPEMPGSVANDLKRCLSSPK
ncbi:MAG: peroxiredoxin family protein [Gemmataceae bacterium]|nr:peroxiredoxin family protein [Gemmataceae bacterium]